MSGEAGDHIADDELLWRRIHPSHYKDTGGGLRVVSGAFRTEDLCLDRAAVLAQHGHGIEFTAAGGVGVGELSAERLRAHDLEPEAEPEHGNPAHSVVRGKISRSVATRLSEECVFRPWPPPAQ